MKCPKCNADLPDDSNFCTQCGATLATAEAQAAQEVPAQPQAAPPPPPPQYQVPPPPPPQFQVPPPPPPAMVNQKSRTVYIILAIFLGGLGVHNFYAGRTGIGVAQLLITIFSCGTIPIWLWALVEACIVTTDGNGIPMN